MIDDTFGLIFDIVVEFVPTIVWKLLLFVIGMVMTAAGVTMFDESAQAGNVLIAVGVVLLVGTLLSLVR